jgi:hypothetical protein
MGTQVNIIDHLEHIKDRAVFAAGAFADPTWIEEAEVAVILLCRIGRDFTTDDVHALLIKRGSTTPEPRALGAVILRAAKDKRIVPTGQYKKSVRRECHRRPLAVWRPTLKRIEYV